MVVTRNGKSTAAALPAPRRMKFQEENTSMEADYHTADEAGGDEPAAEEDLDSDDAPEEESVSSSKSLVLQLQRQQRALEQEQKRLEKERRRHFNEVHAEQQRLKREAQHDTKPAKDLPEFLPGDVLAAMADAEDEEESQPQGKHLRLEDFEELDQRQLARHLKEEQLRQLKLQKRQTIKRGPVHVRVAKAPSRNSAPAAESKVLNARSKWLKRKSLAKR